MRPSGRRGRGRRRTRRLRNLRRLAKAGVAVAVALAFLVLGDRFALLFAERETEDQLQKSLRLEAAPQVEIDGFPFLTQVLDKRIGTAHVTVPDVAADRVSLARVHATAHDVRLDGELPSHLRGGTIRSVDGDALLSFEDLDRELGASQVRFSKLGPGAIKAEGEVPIGGQRLRLHAEARIGRSGDRGVSTDVSRMRLDIGDVAVFRPGRNGGLRLTPKAARAVAEQRNKVRAMLAVPVIAERAGIDRSQIRDAMRSESALDRLTGTPGFVGELMKVNLFDVVADQPDLPAKLGVDPRLMGAVRGVTEPQLADRLDLSFELPRTPGDIRIQRITVERDGIRAHLSGGALPFGGTSGARAAGGR
ncbi:LmeA family phospholipid-binding protein [Streptomyces griseoluteus]|uniref:LmeA family phospholipid-binding protein n=1 Tax=Streptomyces griseoluteus TaxID=29306 RepID=UPI00381369E3